MKKVLLIGYHTDDAMSYILPHYLVCHKKYKTLWLAFNKKPSRAKAIFDRSTIAGLCMADYVVFLGAWQDDKRTRYAHDLCTRMGARIFYSVRELP